MNKQIISFLALILLFSTSNQIIDSQIDISEEAQEERVLEEAEGKSERSDEILDLLGFKSEPHVHLDNPRLGYLFRLHPSLRAGSPFRGVPIYLANQSLKVYS